MAGNLVMHLITFHFGNTKKTVMPPLIPYRALIADFFICLQQILCKTILNYVEKGYLPSAIFLENFRIF